MKLRKIISLILATCLLFSLGATAVSAGTPRDSMLDTTVTLAPGATYTSYQYEPATTRTNCYAQAWCTGNGKATMTFRGASSIGGSRATIGTQSITAYSTEDDNLSVTDSPLRYRYYDVTLKNTGSTTSTFNIALMTDWQKSYA